ncbi:hypothetical protein RJ639_002588 [Escallonia herrerae]|uniref:Uncharacterized protein n=1 Tax=Escallonia herrerae TaxID=1293975 RepID=A0AA89BHZ0_9ASTE|nr:hypothetical protein RJ639_002588 [Escallonia herrerae]
MARAAEAMPNMDMSRGVKKEPEGGDGGESRVFIAYLILVGVELLLISGSHEDIEMDSIGTKQRRRRNRERKGTRAVLLVAKAAGLEGFLVNPLPCGGWGWGGWVGGGVIRREYHRKKNLAATMLRQIEQRYGRDGIIGKESRAQTSSSTFSLAPRSFPTSINSSFFKSIEHSSKTSFQAALNFPSMLSTTLAESEQHASSSFIN